MVALDALRPQLEEFDDVVAQVAHLLELVEGGKAFSPAQTSEVLADVLGDAQHVAGMLEQLAQPIALCRRAVDALISRIAAARESTNHN